MYIGEINNECSKLIKMLETKNILFSIKPGWNQYFYYL